MPYQLDIVNDMEDNETEVSVLDVYDIASEIGKEFEKMIDVYGTDAVTSLMPKVINALEHLEDLATRDEREKNVVQELRARIAHLESDKVEKAEERLRFEKELEQIEDHWREESKDLYSMVSRLQDENRKLSSMLAEKANKSSDNQGTVLSPEVDTTVMQRLRVLVDKLRDQLKDREKEVQIKQAEVDSLSSQVEQLNLVTKELRRKQRVVQAQVHTLIGERADFLAQVHDQQRELQLLRQRLGLAQKENEDLACSAAEIPDLTHKVMYDADDPNRPRFTTQELRDILHERNELKARVSDLEDELEMYRPRSLSRVDSTPPSTWSLRPQGLSGGGSSAASSKIQRRFRSTAFIPSLFPLHVPILDTSLNSSSLSTSPVVTCRSSLSTFLYPPNYRSSLRLSVRSGQRRRSKTSSPPSGNPSEQSVTSIRFGTPNINGASKQTPRPWESLPPLKMFPSVSSIASCSSPESPDGDDSATPTTAGSAGYSTPVCCGKHTANMSAPCSMEAVSSSRELAKRAAKPIHFFLNGPL